MKGQSANDTMPPLCWVAWSSRKLGSDPNISIFLNISRSRRTSGVPIDTVSHPKASTALYSAEFFALQLRFAARVAELSGLPFTETVGSYTNIYVRLGMGQQLDHANPDWLEYVSALATARDPAAWTYEIHSQRAHLPTGPKMAASVGCFSYSHLGRCRVRLHFHAGSQVSEAPLSAANGSLRRQELTTLMSKAAALGGDVHVVGASWLYNLRSYRRLFPKSYLSSLKPVDHPYQRMPLWGQFLNRDRTVRADAAQYFNAHADKAVSLAELSSCFPYQVLATSVPAMWLLS